MMISAKTEERMKKVLSEFSEMTMEDVLILGIEKLEMYVELGSEQEVRA